MFRLVRLKPPHGWNAVAWEFGIVTVGVLMALGVQQWADARSWKARADDAMKALAQENEANFEYAAEFTAVAPCVEAQLDALATRIESANARLQPVPAVQTSLGMAVYRRPLRPYQSTVWDSLVADGVAARLPDEKRLKVANSYDAIAMLRHLSDLSAETVNRTSVLLRPLEMNAATKLSLLQDIVAERSRVSGAQNMAANTMAILDNAGLAPSDTVIAEKLERSGTIAYCRAVKLPLADWRALRDSKLPTLPGAH